MKGTMDVEKGANRGTLGTAPSQGWWEKKTGETEEGSAT